jgi:excinuclease ABC subunit A
MHHMNKKSMIRVRGAREHNLKDISVDIPKQSLTVITGPSGSGKSSLALGVVYAEGQRRYMESLSSYARQFLGMPKKADCDRIEGLTPAIAINQKTVGQNPRSTVGTITEIHDYLRVLFARIGNIHCIQCEKQIDSSSPEQIKDMIHETYADQSIMVCAPKVRERKGEFAQLLQELFQAGYYHMIIDGERHRFRSIDDIANLDLKKTYKHTIDVIVDMVEVVPDEIPRLLEAVEKACVLGDDMCKVRIGDEEHMYSTRRMCTDCGKSFPALEPRMFSFNSPLGACKVCHGLGMIIAGDWYDYYMKNRYTTCHACDGKRFNDTTLSVTVKGYTIHSMNELSVKHAKAFFEAFIFAAHEQAIAEPLRDEIVHRLGFLEDVGLGYLSLNRTARSLSGGESQRIRLARQLGALLSGVTYILDEPSIGLHQRDHDQLIATLKRLRDLENTVIVVEHDHDTMRASDYIIDLGPASGQHGGSIVAAGTPDEIAANPASLTGQYLSNRLQITREQPLRTSEQAITVHDAHKNNLKNIDVSFPLGVLTGISGVSGSGKSSLVMEELVPALQSILSFKQKKMDVSKISGMEHLENIVVIDQNPIGRTPRSNAATYLGIFDDIRKLFAQTQEAQARGYMPGRFSFNVRGGRCAKCSGDGTITVSMQLLPDVVMECKRCKGLRYSPETLDITYKNMSIADILAMTVREATEFFAHHRQIHKRLALLCDVGLDYIKLGQPATTLSGGEAQRVKLVDELAKRGRHTMYVLDEPTTGLHTADVANLIQVLQRLVDKGNSVVVIEHNLELLKIVDHIIDLGPEGGDAGGSIVAQGAPKDIIHNTASHTARYLQTVL